MRKTKREQTSQLVLGGVSIEIKRRLVKRLRISVYPPDGRVQVVAPFLTSEAYLQSLITEKLSWIKAKQALLSSGDAQTPLNYSDGETHYFLGHPYQLQVLTHKGAPVVCIRSEKTLALYMRGDSSGEARGKVLDNWYRSQLQVLIPVLLDKWQPEIGVAAREWGIRRMKTRWGTCNITAKRIWLNLELAKKPFDCLEYVVVHELVHLLERNHNARFWSLVGQFLPDWRARKALLNQRGKMDQL